MSYRLGVVMDPIAGITPCKDTSFAMLLAAQKMGLELFYMTIEDLFLAKELAMGRYRELLVKNNDTSWFELGNEYIAPLGELDVILMRKDPPFNQRFLHSTYILELASQQGCFVVNDPKSLRECNEKLFALQFSQCCPDSLTSASPERLKAFCREYGDVIYKPLDGMGGSNVFRCRASDPNLSVILDVLTQGGSEYIMAQQFISDIAAGDKRILVVNGEAIPYCLARIPAEGEVRGNLAAGGSGRAQPLSKRDKWIVSQVAPTLLEKKLYFVGLDVIGDYLTEINVTSPTCAREIDAAYGTDIGADFIRAILSCAGNGLPARH